MDSTVQKDFSLVHKEKGQWLVKARFSQLNDGFWLSLSCADACSSLYIVTCRRQCDVKLYFTFLVQQLFPFLPGRWKNVMVFFVSSLFLLVGTGLSFTGWKPPWTDCARLISPLYPGYGSYWSWSGCWALYPCCIVFVYVSDLECRKHGQ
jgi:hypothetical protein